MDSFGIRAIPLDDNESIKSVSISESQKTDIKNHLNGNINQYIAMIKQYVAINQANLPGIDTTPIYTQVNANTEKKRFDYANKESKGSFFF